LGFMLQVVPVFALVAHFSGLLLQMTFVLVGLFFDGKLFNFESALHVFYLFVLLFDDAIIPNFSIQWQCFFKKIRSGRRLESALCP